MIRAHRISATAQDDPSLVSAWNVAPNIAYDLRLLPGTISCGVLLYNADGQLVASGAALTGTGQPCILIPQTGQTIGMIDAELGWHLLLTTTGEEAQRTIRINPSVDLPDEIHPIYADDDLALARATARIDSSAHYIDDVTVSCPLGLGAGLGDVASVPVDGAAMVGQVESVMWAGKPNGAQEQAVMRRHVAIAPAAFVEIVPPVVTDDAGATTNIAPISGNVLANDAIGLTVAAVNGLSSNVGVVVDGDNGGVFVIASDGAWTFDPEADFASLGQAETQTTAATYHASDGVAESMGTLSVVVSRFNAAPIVTNDVAAINARQTASGNVLANDSDTDGDPLTVVEVNGEPLSVGVSVSGTGGGSFLINADGSWVFDPGSAFDTLTEGQTSTTSATYTASDGVLSASAIVTVTVSAPPAVIEFISSSIVSAKGSSGITLTVPIVDAQPGDLLVLMGCISTLSTDPQNLIAPGFTSVATVSASDNYKTSINISIMIAPDPVPASIIVGNFLSSQTPGSLLMVWRGVDQSNPIDVPVVTASGINSSSINPGEITPASNGAGIIIMGAATVAPSTAAVVTIPAGWDNISVRGQVSVHSGYASVAFGGATKIAQDTTPIDPASWSVSYNNSYCAWAAATIALRPAS